MLRTTTPLALVLGAGLALAPTALAQRQAAGPPRGPMPIPGRPIGNTENVPPPALDAEKPAPHDGPVVQVALLLDTSNSMDGLIDQARGELWTVVNRLQGLEHGAGDVQFQVALYQYGNNALESADGYVQLRAPFTTDLDVVSEQMFALVTNGGSEYCGWVIGDASRDLDWIEPRDEGEAPVLRMIVIAGNEPFSQGSVSYSESIADASNRGVRVHTVFCGDERLGERTYWADGAAKGEGFYFAIDQNRHMRFSTPYDEEILQYNRRLNTTYHNFAADGRGNLARQLTMDADNEAASTEQAVQRAATKAGAFYGNAHWDIVDAYTQGELDEDDIAWEVLPEAWRDLSYDELTIELEKKHEERKAIQEEIKELYEKREAVVEEKRREAGVVTLGEALSRAIIDQAREQGFTHARDAPTAPPTPAAPPEPVNPEPGLPDGPGSTEDTTRR